MTMVPVTLALLLVCFAISVDMGLSKEIFNLLESNKSFSTSGYPLPCSHFETACLLTSSISASSSCDKWCSFRNCFKLSAKLILFVTSISPPIIDIKVRIIYQPHFAIPQLQVALLIILIFPVSANQGGSHKCSQSKYHTHHSVAERCLW